MGKRGRDRIAAAGRAKRKSTTSGKPRNLLNDDPAAADLLSVVARHGHVPEGLLLHRSRCAAGVATTRQLAMYLMHVTLGRTFSEIGRYFGRDRTTVAYACARIEDLREGAFDEDITRIEHAIALSLQVLHEEPAHAAC